MSILCDICERWPRVPSDDYDGLYCAYHTWLMHAWSRDVGREYELTVERGLPRDHWRVRLSVWWERVTTRPLCAIRHGGPFDFAPWSTITRAICRWTHHNWPVRVAMSSDLDEDGRRWWLYRCTRCDGTASLPDGECNGERFAEDVSYNTIWCGFVPLPEPR